MSIPAELLPDATSTVSILSGFLEDLMTEFVPDPLGAADILRWLAAEPATDEVLDRVRRGLTPGWVRVVRPGRDTEQVPAPDVTVRAGLHILVERDLGAQPIELLPTACGYRDAGSSYTDEFLRRLRLQEYFVDQPSTTVVAVTDIEDFLRSVQIEILQATPWASRELLSALHVVDRAFGSPLLFGHYSNRIGNALLSQIDDRWLQLGLPPYVRWMDDFHIFASSRASAFASMDALETELGRLGMQLHSKKTDVLEPEEYRRLYLRDPGRSRMDVATVYRRGRAEGRRREVRYALGRLIRAADPAVVGDCAAAARADPSLLPRLAAYLDALASGQHSGVPEHAGRQSARVLHDDLSDAIAAQLAELLEDWSEWALARLLPFAVRNPGFARSAVLHAAERGMRHPAVVIRGLAWRVLRRVGELSAEAASLPTRYHVWEEEGDDEHDLPIVASRL